MAEFWAEWGLLAYAGAAGWAFFEGETFVLLAAAAGAASGIVDPWILLLSVWIGSFAGDQFWFFLGRHFGERAIRRIPGAAARLPSAMRFIHGHRDIFILTFRFAYGMSPQAYRRKALGDHAADERDDTALAHP